MKKLFKMLVLALSFSLITPMVQAEGKLAMLTNGAQAFVDGAQSVWQLGCDVSFSCYENAQTLRMLSVGVLAGYGVYSIADKLIKEKDRNDRMNRKPGILRGFRYFADSAWYYAKVATLAGATGLTLYSLYDYNRLAAA